MVKEEKLISIVRGKRVLWDPKHKFYRHSTVLEKVWKDIAAQMKEDEHKVRKKWRYLRDQYCVELGRLAHSKLEDGTESHYDIITWPFFKSLSFLKGSVSPRTSTKLKKRIAASAAASMDDSEDSREHVPSLPFAPEIKIEVVETADNFEDMQFPNPNIEASSSDVKMDGNDSDVSESRQDTCSRKTKGARKQMCSDEDDENLHFFKSLLPHIRNIPAQMMLPFRSRIQDVVDEFAYRSQMSETSYSPDDQ